MEAIPQLKPVNLERDRAAARPLLRERLIAVRNLNKIYRPQVDDPSAQEVRALDGVDLDIMAGDYVSIVGPSGSGKSTLMQILGLLDRPSNGTYELHGRDITTLDDDETARLRSREIGFIFQFFNLLPRTTCLDNVALPMLYNGRSDTNGPATELLRRFGLENRLYHKPHQLSGGQQQRVAIARSLANSPRILFADEPTGNINSEQSAEVMDLLERLNRSGVTIVLVTHEPDVAARARRQITICDGRITRDERLRDLPDLNIETGSGGREQRQKQRDEYSEAEAGIAGIAALAQEISSAEPAEEQSGWWRLVRENLRMAAIALSLNKLRTALATLGVVIGIASVVAMVAIGAGAQQAISEQLSALGTNLLSVRAVSTNSGAGGSYYRKLTLEDHRAIREQITERSPIRSADAKVFGNVVAAFGAQNETVELVGSLPVSERMESNTPVVGRFFTEKENQARARVAVIGQTVVRNLFGENVNPVGSIIKINRIDFNVIGVLPPKGATAFRDRDNVLLIPLYTAMYRVLGRHKLHNITIEVRNQDQIPAVTESITDLLRKRRRIPDYRDNDFEIRNMNEIQKIYNRTTKIISSMLAAIAAVSLLVGGIGIMNVMLVAVKERTREVGLRKALGANRRTILMQFLIESVLIGLLGGIIGIVAGVVISLSASNLFAWPAVIPLSAVLIAFGFALTVGMVFGIWPAKQAADLSPIEALRYE